MVNKINLKNNYRVSLCCKPSPGDDITGFLKSESGLISIHKSGCGNLNSIQPERSFRLTWHEVLSKTDPMNLSNEPDFLALDEIDFRILRHHSRLGVDYAAVVAKSIGVERETVFQRHKKLRDLKLIARVHPKMIQYRKNIVNNKWVKHRSHTYYEITDKGLLYLSYRK